MQANKSDIYVYFQLPDNSPPRQIGILTAHQAKGRKAFSFTYSSDWMNSREQILLDPDIGWYSGPQFPSEKENFGMILDSMPDRWGRMLMKRRANQLAADIGMPPVQLYDMDFLLGVQDESRMGAIRFKRDPQGSFLDNHPSHPIPPISSLRELQFATKVLESEKNDESVRKWLEILLAPGSSLGGARPKANVYDPDGQLWIAKFPSKSDETDKGAWEYLAYILATKAKVNMSESSIKKGGKAHHIFITKRFDRIRQHRIHFASAMTMTGNSEETIRDKPPSYLDLAEFIQFSSSNIISDLHQLWRRIVFNIAISNTDDHLRNHGFLLSDNGWVLSPAYDLNPSPEKAGLSLNIDMDRNDLDFDLAFGVGEYFQLSRSQMDKILKEVTEAVSIWPEVAKGLGIPRSEQLLMASAFNPNHL